jgi:hypothetical protein
VSATEPCRRCGAALDPAAHRIARDVTWDNPVGEETRPVTHRSWTHIPCPFCGEAEPLKPPSPLARLWQRLRR